MTPEELAAIVENAEEVLCAELWCVEGEHFTDHMVYKVQEVGTADVPRDLLKDILKDTNVVVRLGDENPKEQRYVVFMQVCCHKAKLKRGNRWKICGGVEVSLVHMKDWEGLKRLDLGYRVELSFHET